MEKFILDDDNLWKDNRLTDRQTDRQTINSVGED